MELKILSQSENKLFRRKEAVFEVASLSAPRNDEVIQAISKKFSSPEDAVAIKKIGGRFGTKSFKISANIYSSKEEKDAIEVKPSKQKKAKAV